MTSKNTKQTAVVLQSVYTALRPHLASGYACDSYFSDIYDDYAGGLAYLPSVVSKYYTGSRVIQRCMAAHYADYDSDNPRCPDKLYDSLRSMTGNYSLAVRRIIHAVLISYIDTIPAADKPLLLSKNCTGEHLSTDELAALWTRVLWYAMCADLSNSNI